MLHQIGTAKDDVAGKMLLRQVVDCLDDRLMEFGNLMTLGNSFFWTKDIHLLSINQQGKNVVARFWSDDPINAERMHLWDATPDELIQFVGWIEDRLRKCLV